MAYYTTGHRTINGERRKVRLLHENGKIRSVRMAGQRVSTDKTARREGQYRQPHYANNPQSARRVNYHIHQHVSHASLNKDHLDRMRAQMTPIDHMHAKHRQLGQMLLRHY